MTETVNLPVPVRDLDVHELAALARNVAVNIAALPVILDKFKISQEQYDRYLTLPFYKTTLEQYIVDWEKASNAERRLQLQALAGLEDGMVVLAARMANSSEPLPAAVEVGKLFSKIAGIGEATKGTNPGEKFVITINLGDPEPIRFEKDITPAQPAPKEIEHE